MAQPLGAMLSRVWRKICYAELYVEAAINVITGFIQLFSPALSLTPLTRAGVELCGVALEAQRWSGAFTLTFGGLLLLRVLVVRFEPRALKLLLEVLCVGDIIYLGALAPFSVSFGALPLGLAPFLLTAPMFCCRLLLRMREDWEGACREAEAAPLGKPGGDALLEQAH